jgi:hypothetical protein
MNFVGFYGLGDVLKIGEADSADSIYFLREKKVGRMCVSDESSWPDKSQDDNDGSLGV